MRHIQSRLQLLEEAHMQNVGRWLADRSNASRSACCEDGSNDSGGGSSATRVDGVARLHDALYPDEKEIAKLTQEVCAQQLDSARIPLPELEKGGERSVNRDLCRRRRRGGPTRHVMSGCRWSLPAA